MVIHSDIIIVDISDMWKNKSLDKIKFMIHVQIFLQRTLSTHFLHLLYHLHQKKI